MSHIGLILLAAGGSVRMGRPKQLLPYKGRSLLRHAAEVAMQSGCSPVICVLGANAFQASSELTAAGDIVVENNDDWHRGVGTSIVAGLRRLMKDRPDAHGVVICLCDQPHITAAHIASLRDTHRATGKAVVASCFGNTLGPPCFFAASWFDRLLSLGENEGAKRLILAAGDDVATVVVPEAAIDVDTPNDYANLSHES